jgi:uncharacterized protein YbjT (DUF2867 family)
MILVTGATGNVGGYVCDRLNDQQVSFVKAVREPTQQESERWLDFLNPTTFEAALRGITHVFLVRPPALAKPEQDMRPFLEACKKYQIDHIVFLSLQGVEQNAFTPHAKIEKLIETLNLPFTFLRPSFFMQNLTMQHKEEIRKDSILFMPAGNGLTNFIDARDIADAAAVCLQDKEHIGKKHTLTGSHSYSYYDVANLLSAELGRTIHYAKPGLIRYWVKSIRGGMSVGFAMITGIIYTIARLGKADGTNDTLATLLHRPPRSLEQFIKEHRKLWL